jgi:hypothetical protein
MLLAVVSGCAVKAPAPDYSGIWYATNTSQMTRAAVVIDNQTNTSFDYEYNGWWGANSGLWGGTAIISESGESAKHSSDEGEVVFSFDNEVLRISSSAADGYSLSIGYHVYAEGEFTRGEPIYTDANILNEILPTVEIQSRVSELLGAAAYDDMLEVMKFGGQILFADDALNVFTYSGFVHGGGLGVDLLIDGENIYCLLYKIYDENGSVQTFFTNDATYSNALPPQFSGVIRDNFEVNYVYKSLD